MTRTGQQVVCKACGDLIDWTDDESGVDLVGYGIVCWSCMNGNKTWHRRMKRNHPSIWKRFLAPYVADVSTKADRARELLMKMKIDRYQERTAPACKGEKFEVSGMIRCAWCGHVTTERGSEEIYALGPVCKECVETRRDFHVYMKANHGGGYHRAIEPRLTEAAKQACDLTVEKNAQLYHEVKAS